ncbi:MAG: glycoside hydrolase family 27 protein [Ferruginibacter sp.]|nr:glycoside hydrolase family 27 protein [Ferruginibacter sp.]
MKKCFFILCMFCSLLTFAQKFENLAPTPPMGWNSWNTFQTNISEKLVMETADMLVSSGMKAAGYTYLVLDDGWMAMERNPKTGDLMADPKKFPNGMKAVADYVHAKGLKFGLYNCAGTKTCAGYPGTRGYEYQDARLYASFEIDYLKFDWCSADGLNAKESYTTMSKALKAAGRPILFSLCEWGNSKPWKWATNIGQMWRTTGDISRQFDGIEDKGTYHNTGVMKIVDLQDTLSRFAGPGHWNDPDMLQVGNGMTLSEDRTHFSIWCMMAAPLIAGNDIRKMSKETHALLIDKDVLAIDQDTLGVQGFKYSDKDSLQTWFKPLGNGAWAVCFLNRSATPKQAQFNWKATMVTDAVTKTSLNAQTVTYKIFDVWTKKNAGTTDKNINASVAPHDVLMLRLSR